MKIGTVIVAPVSTVAGFLGELAVSPRTPGSVYVTFNSTNGGNSQDKAESFSVLIKISTS